uniref:Uncharacterized protein n=1 Tax=Arundo donax TaxID=35708 RepID=A0A0A9HSY1_ARUDO
MYASRRGAASNTLRA